MSNGDVLDNWEEIDEAELANKIQKLEKECKTKENTNSEDIKSYSTFISTEDDSEATVSAGKMKLLQRAAQTKILPSGATTAPGVENITSPLDDMSSTFQPVLMVLHKDVDEYQSANYTQPTNTQTVKILRRPTQSSEPRNNGVRPKQPIKTLQQREQEYAEARLRILGSAKNPEDDSSANESQTPSPSSNSTATSKTTTTTTTTTPTTTQSTTSSINTQPKNALNARNQPQPQTQQPQQQQQQQHFVPIQSSFNNYYQQPQQQQTIFYPKQQVQQQQQQLSHSLSMPTFGSNRLQFSTTGLLPTPPIAPLVGSNLQQRHQFQPMQHFNQQQIQQSQQLQQHQHQHQQTWSPVVGGSVSSYTLQRQQQRQQQMQQQQQQQQEIDILRAPRGPDGSTGFQMRR